MDKQQGLNTAWSLSKGASLRLRIKWLMCEIRYAWQRAWRGYDDAEIYDLGYTLIWRMPMLLTEFKKRNCALFPDKDGGKLSLTKEETDAVIDEMIFYFENCDEDVVYKRLFGKCICDTEYDEEEMKQVYEELNRCETEAMRLLSKWIMHLWY